MSVTLHVGHGVEGVPTLTQELLDWETVSRAVGDGRARAVVLARALQLGRALAAERGEAVLVRDGDDVHVLAPSVPSPAPPVVEPTPWGTGAALAGFTALVVVVGLLALTAGVARLNALLAVVVDLVVVGGLAPSAWLARERPVWRWVALGFAVGAGLTVLWLALRALT